MQCPYREDVTHLAPRLGLKNEIGQAVTPLGIVGQREGQLLLR